MFFTFTMKYFGLLNILQYEEKDFWCQHHTNRTLGLFLVSSLHVCNLRFLSSWFAGNELLQARIHQRFCHYFLTCCFTAGKYLFRDLLTPILLILKIRFLVEVWLPCQCSNIIFLQCTSSTGSFVTPIAQEGFSVSIRQF